MNFQANPQQLKWLKALIFLLCLLPASRLAWLDWHGQGAEEAIELAQRWTGTWTFNLLLLTLCISPLRVLSDMHWLLRLRRMLGLFTFFYAALHLLTFVGMDHDFVPEAIARDIFKRPYVSLGFAALLLLIPLAATSNQWAVRRLGGRRWQELHRNIYLIGIFASGHYLWLAKDEQWPWAIASSAAMGLLIAWRIRERRRKAIPATRIQDAKPIRFFKNKPD
jgi:methionine sulfoxide reductase heme-binding subunit